MPTERLFLSINGVWPFCSNCSSSLKNSIDHTQMGIILLCMYNLYKIRLKKEYSIVWKLLDWSLKSKISIPFKSVASKTKLCSDILNVCFIIIEYFEYMSVCLGVFLRECLCSLRSGRFSKSQYVCLSLYSPKY